ncbi:hypothetical protein FACS189479_06610 [Spirochaetia bacterium]|nr:hypothetical protein FACS189479_06610 [Spirochaetia bacterium]
MKKDRKGNVFLLAMPGKAIVIAVLAFGLVLAGCATTGGGREDNPYTGIPIPAEIQSLAGALDWISANAVDGGTYTVTLKADETVQVRSFSYGGKQVSITLKGDADGRDVSLSGRGSLFSVGGGVTLNVENLRLKGRGNSESAANDSPLVRVQSGGVLKLKAGAVITENYNSGYGGGVWVGENAALIMEGGEIRGNTAKGNGGVEVWKGTFTMEGGTIRGNTATGDHGGGVGISENAAFTMKGGAISGNMAVKTIGGGVNVNKNAVFIMEGGAISDNIANFNGGGVSINGGVFTMEGGTISGNISEGSGGVFVMENATFAKKGGTIYGDTDAIHTPGSTENTASVASATILGWGGHAINARGDKSRNATAGPEITLYAKHENGVWTYNDSSPGGVGDTTANWE